MEKSWKSRLQEYCQQNKLPSPNYRIRQETGNPNQRRYQMEVEVNGRWYTSAENYLSKREAEHAAAENACRDLMRENTNIEHREQPPVESNINDENSITCFPPEYADIEEFIVTMVTAFGGRIRKIRPRDRHGLIRVDIAGSYRYCHRIERQHRKNQVYLLVDPQNKVYYQKCYDPDCRGFKSAPQRIYMHSNPNV